MAFIVQSSSAIEMYIAINSFKYLHLIIGGESVTLLL